MLIGFDIRKQVDNLVRGVIAVYNDIFAADREFRVDILPRVLRSLLREQVKMQEMIHARGFKQLVHAKELLLNGTPQCLDLILLPGRFTNGKAMPFKNILWVEALRLFINIDINFFGGTLLQVFGVLLGKKEHFTVQELRLILVKRRVWVPAAVFP